VAPADDEPVGRVELEVAATDGNAFDVDGNRPATTGSRSAHWPIHAVIAVEDVKCSKTRSGGAAI
jgi:hypothetical protein